MSDIKSLLKPEGSITSGIATAGLVYAVYQLSCGSIADCHVTEPMHPSLVNGKQKAGWIAFAAVAGITLITRDGNVGVLGFASIIAMELAYRHAISTNPYTSKLEAPVSDLYQPAAVTEPDYSQGVPASPFG